MREDFRVIVAGTRTFDDYEFLCYHCDYFLSEMRKKRRIVIVSGRANGADQMGERYARERGYSLRTYPANWERYGNRAGPIRNELMAQNADALIAYWDGRSPGTKNMIDMARDYGLLVRIKIYSS